jgi:hypothetical protein
MTTCGGRRQRPRAAINSWGLWLVSIRRPGQGDGEPERLQLVDVVAGLAIGVGAVG